MEDETIFGDDSDEEIIPSKETDFSKITSFAVSYPIRALKDMIDQNIIDLKPEFQRGFVWDIKRASKLIDSILSNLPIPNILLARRKTDESFIVVDGQQRLMTICSFLNGRFRTGDKEVTFKLKGLENKSWNEKQFIELDLVLQKKILNTALNSTILDNIDDDPRVIFETFYRLNTGGIPLTDQEIRNCIFKGNFNQILKELNNYEPWRKLISEYVPSKRMKDEELILRFFSLYNGKYLEYIQPMREWLNENMKNNQNGSEDIKNFIPIFKATIDYIKENLPIDVFKGGKRNFNRALLDAIVVSISEGITKKNIKNDPISNYEKLIEEGGNFWEYVTTGTTDKKKVKGRIEMAKSAFLEV